MGETAGIADSSDDTRDRGPQQQASDPVASWSALLRGGVGRLVFGLSLLELATAFQAFAISAVLPVVASSLHASHSYGWLAGAAGLAGIVSAALSPLFSRWLGRLRTALVATVLYVIGGVAAAWAADAGVFVTGRALQGFGSGVLATFGVSAIAHAVPEHLRSRVYSLISAMWVLPALIGPVYAAGVNALLGWHWTLTLFLPAVILGRILISREAALHAPDDRPFPVGSAVRTLLRTALLVAGCVLVLVGTGTSWGPAPLLALAGIAIVGWSVARMLPQQATRSSKLAMLGVMTLTMGYLGIESIGPLAAETGFGASVGKAAVMITAGTLTWSAGSLAQPRLVELWTRRGVDNGPARVAALGAVLLLVPSAGLPLMLALHASADLALPLMWVIWLCAGLGVGFAFPALSLIAVSVKELGSVDDLAAGLTLADLLGGSLGSVLAGGLYTLGVEHLRWSTQSSLALAIGALVLVFAGTVWLAVAQLKVAHKARPHLTRRRHI